MSGDGASAAASAASASSIRSPTRASSASVARSGVGAAAEQGDRGARCRLPDSSTSRADRGAARARSRRGGGRTRRTRGRCARRDRRHLDLDQHLVGLDRRRQVGDEEVGDRDRPLAAASRRTRTRASSAVNATGSSAAGSAWATEPPTVPRLRIWACATKLKRLGQQRPVVGHQRRAPRASTGASSPRSAACRPARRIPASAPMRLRSIRCSGWARRKLSSGTRLWPPASTLPSSPCSASRLERLVDAPAGRGSRTAVASTTQVDVEGELARLRPVRTANRAPEHEQRGARRCPRSASSVCAPARRPRRAPPRRPSGGGRAAAAAAAAPRRTRRRLRRRSRPEPRAARPRLNLLSRRLANCFIIVLGDVLHDPAAELGLAAGDLEVGDGDHAGAAVLPLEVVADHGGGRALALRLAGLDRDRGGVRVLVDVLELARCRGSRRSSGRASSSSRRGRRRPRRRARSCAPGRQVATRSMSSSVSQVSSSDAATVKLFSSFI